MKRGLNIHFRQFKKGIEMIATTWGMRYFVKEENIFATSVGIFVLIFFTVIGLTIYDAYTARKE